MPRKIKRHALPNLKMSIKTECPKCKMTKLIPREAFEKISEEEFQKGEIFLYQKCNIKMNPVSVEVDY